MLSRRSALRRPIRVFIFITIIAVVIFGVLEIGLRLLKPRHQGLRTLLHKSTLQTDYSRVDTLHELMDQSIIGYRPFAEIDGYVLNSRGLRTKEYTEVKEFGTYRVVALGDSFTFGGVPTASHWTSVLGKAIAECRHDQVEVLRMGVPSTGPPFQLRLWQIEGARLNPDLVVLGFFVGNDFFDEQGRLPGWRSWLDQLSTVSYAALAVRNLSRLSGFRPQKDQARSPEAPPRSHGVGGYEISGYEEIFNKKEVAFSRRRFLRIEAERMSLCLKDEQWKLRFRFDRVARFLDEMHAEVTATSARFVVLIIPDEYQVNDGLMRAVAASAGHGEEDYDLAAPQRLLTAFCVDRGIECLDLLPVFRHEGADRRLYLRRDTHWNQAGNILAARELGAHVCESSRW